MYGVNSKRLKAVKILILKVKIIAVKILLLLHP